MAWGTLLGAVIGMGCHVFYNMPRTQSAIRLPVTAYVSGVLKSFGLAGLPFVVAYVVVVGAKHAVSGVWAGALVFSMGVCLFGLVSNYRQKATGK